MLSRRNEWLNKKLGMEYDKDILGENSVKSEVVAAPSPSEVVPVEQDDETLKASLLANQKQLELMVEIGQGVLTSSADSATTLQKSRDVEAFANLLGKMTETQTALVAIKEKRFGKTVNTPQTLNQTNIMVQSTRELNKILKEKYINKIEEPPNG